MLFAVTRNMQIRLLILLPLLFCGCYQYIDNDTDDVDYYIALADDVCDLDNCTLKERRYFIVGNERKLWEQKIIRRVKGLTRQYYINPAVRGGQMREINAMTAETINVNGSQIRVLGIIPHQAYEIKDNLVIIKNKHMFWRYNKLLVITHRE